MTVKPLSKHERRLALESPYAREAEASKAAIMAKAVPKGFDALISWFREVIHEEVPVSIHKSGVWHDHGEDAQGGSLIGSPAIRDEFRRFIEGVPWQTDEDGYYQRPFRAALARYARRWPLTAAALFRLALVDGDWRRYADKEGYNHELAEKYLMRALYELWTEYAEQRRLT